jgi:DNA-binding NarL/FixJ family response regulator
MTLSLAPTPAPPTSAEAHQQLGELIFLNRDADAQAGHTASVSRTIRVVVADGQALVRAGFRVLLEGEQGIAVAGEAASGDETVALARHIKPDVVLVDIGLPGLDALEATRQIAADPELQDVQVMILTTHDCDEHVFGALRAGASGFLVKDTEPTDLLHAVRVLARGDALLAPSVTRRVIAELNSQPDRQSPAQLEELTAREREVMALVAEGLTNREIAERLVVSPATARTHVSRAMVKLDARNRAQLVVVAYQSGLVPVTGEAL